MNFELNPTEERILGCLIEKEMATPEYYPLTLNALVNACNQKSNRTPVMALDSSTVENTLYELKTEFKLAFQVSSGGSRVAKYRHNFAEHWNFSPAKMAIISVLLLRGPQTAGDIRTRTARLYPFSDAQEVEEMLHGLETYEGGPFVVHMPKEPGKRERRWAHLFAGEPKIPEQQATVFTPIETESGPSRNERVKALESEVAELQQELNKLKEEFLAFKTAFE